MTSCRDAGRRPRSGAAPARSAASSDPETTRALGASRTTRLLRGVSTAILARGAAAVVPLLLVPITLGYLGVESYGIWMAVLAVTGLVAFADLGMGSGLLTRLTECSARGDNAAARRHVSSAYAVTGAFAVMLLLALGVVAQTIPWASILDLDTRAAERGVSALATVCIGLFIVNVPLSLVTRVQYAYQRVGEANVWTAVGSVLSLGGALLAVNARLEPLLVVGAVAAGPPLASLAASAWVYGRQLPDLAPSVSAVDKATAGALLRLGSQFVVLTAVMSAATSADNLIIAKVLGVADVTTFAVPARLVGQLGLLVSLINMPLWAANGDALARGDIRWVIRSTRRMTLLSAVAIVLPGTILVVAGDQVLGIWLGTDIGATRVLLAGLVVWWLLLATLSPSYMVQNSVGLVRYQLIGWLAYLVVSVPTKLVMAQSFGVDAVPWVGAAVYAATALPAALVGSRVALAGAERRRVTHDV
ncbi:MAG: hypothetical protein JWP95_575 [Actinotalea sp.]|nr:hypothetical protein [Actinotalea sp.]